MTDTDTVLLRLHDNHPQRSLLENWIRCGVIDPVHQDRRSQETTTSAVSVIVTDDPDFDLNTGSQTRKLLLVCDSAEAAQLAGPHVDDVMLLPGSQAEFNLRCRRLLGLTALRPVAREIDPITGALNEAAFQAAALRRHTAGPSAGMQLIRFSCSLRNITRVNTTFGRSVGDLLLEELARRITEGLGPSATFGRLAGPEFVILDECATDAAAETHAATLRQILAGPFEIAGYSIDPGITVEFKATEPAPALAPNPAPDLSPIGTDLDAPSELRDPSIDRALARDEYILLYQPQDSLLTTEIAGLMAMLRWRRPGLGLLVPSDFIPLARLSGQVNDITTWAFDRLAAEGFAEPDRMAHRCSISVDFLTIEKGTLQALVLQALARHPRLRGWLDLGVSVPERVSNALWNSLERLAATGVSISLEIGASSMPDLSTALAAGIRRLQVDIAALSNPAVCAYMAAARTSGLSLTAVAIETSQQLAHARANGITEVQGHYLGPPQPASRAQWRRS